MTTQKNARANPVAFERLLKQTELKIKEIIDECDLKTFQRARKGERLSPESFQKFAKIFKVEMSELILDEDQRAAYEQRVSIQAKRAESLKGFPTDFFESSDPELIVPPEVDARFEIDDPNEEQSELAAQLVDIVESLSRPQQLITRRKASENIRSFGKLNSLIKELAKCGIYLFVGRYEYRHGAWPWLDADESEIAKEVIIDRLLLVFSGNIKSPSISRRVDQGMSLAALQEDIEWLSGELESDAKDKLDELGKRFLEKRRMESKEMLIDFKI